MQVYSLSPMYNNYSNRNFCGKTEKEVSTKKYSKIDYEIAKTKKIASECVTIALGIASLYFVVKKILKTNKITDDAKKIVDSAAKKISKDVKPQTYEDIFCHSVDDLKKSLAGFGK